MDTRELDAALAATLADRRLSRAERRGLAPTVAALRLVGPEGRSLARSRAFAAARAALAGPEGAGLEVLSWLEEVVGLIEASPASGAASSPAEAWFAPGEGCPRRIVGLLGAARRSVDVGVFTITDDRIGDAILGAHRRGLAVRVVTDDEKAGDLGSDVDRLRSAGVAVRVDRSPAHMHHKFAIFDGATLLTGSYNWTRAASIYNRENFVVTADPVLVAAFAGEFERLWRDHADGPSGRM